MDYLMLEKRRDELEEQIEELEEKIKELEEEKDEICGKLYRIENKEQEREYWSTQF